MERPLRSAGLSGGVRRARVGPFGLRGDACGRCRPRRERIAKPATPRLVLRPLRKAQGQRSSHPKASARLAAQGASAAARSWAVAPHLWCRALNDRGAAHRRIGNSPKDIVPCIVHIVAVHIVPRYGPCRDSQPLVAETASSGSQPFHTVTEDRAGANKSYVAPDRIDSQSPTVSLRGFESWGRGGRRKLF